MECFIVGEDDVFASDKYLVLRGDEAHHAVKSLRIRQGETILATTLGGICYRAMLRSVEESKREITIRCEITETLAEHNEPSLDVVLLQAVLNQQSKFEEIVERCTEIGISGFVPVSSARVERPVIKRERIERILRSACKQAQRARIPSFGELVTIETALEHAKDQKRAIVVLHEGIAKEISLKYVLDKVSGKRIAIVIGPEGGFTEEEVSISQEAFGATAASLGPRRLHAETAAITASAITLSFDR
ncbi:MAG TPA: RsmE family RNA methyltransferase [Candidatus Kapabacteria bacterium]|nr:RsmE family RNA methyltransferase [Candidatus Kapabacteria bacterium]